MAEPRAPVAADRKPGGGKVLAAMLAAGLIVGGQAMLDFLGKWEEGGEPQLVVYADKLAGGLPTVCKGLTKHVTSTPIIVGERWTKEKCEREERAAVLRVQKQLLRCFKVEPPEPIFIAATSHSWNFGTAATCGSEAMAAWNAEQWALGCRRLRLRDDGKPVWSYVKTGRILPDGKPEYAFVRGLAKRRADEHQLCMHGVVP